MSKLNKSGNSDPGSVVPRAIKVTLDDSSKRQVISVFRNRTPALLRQCAAFILLLLWVSTAGGQTLESREGDVQSARDDTELLRMFADTLHEIESSYVEEIDREDLIEAAIQGMMSRLDQHSSYIPPSEIRRFRGSIENEYGGIGVQVSLEKGGITVISPFHGSPAYKQGIMAGDTIVSIEGKSTESMSLEEAVNLTTGKVGTPVRISVRHLHSQQIEELVLERALIKMETVLGDHRAHDDNWVYFVDTQHRIAYVRITGFGRTTADELRQVLVDLDRNGMQGLILDLRFNPGGLLSSAIEVCDMFLTEGRIVRTAGRNSIPREWSATAQTVIPDTPICVLVNRYSASASEIVSACLKDNSRATIVGERSFGKGSVQNVIPLEDGRRALKLTTATYYRPNGHNIHRHAGASEDDEWGVRPEQEFEEVFTDDQWASYMEARRSRDAFSPADHVVPHPSQDSATASDHATAHSPERQNSVEVESTEQDGKPESIRPMQLPLEDVHFATAVKHLRQLIGQSK